jgi:protein-S-isoprenylcysteine O-methyltransferase Ste14
MVSKNKRLLQRMRVPLGFLFAIIFMVFARPGWTSLAIGAVIALIGLAVRGWASGHIRKNRELAVSGPYSYTRNPLYLGSFILGLGFTVASGVWWLALLFCALFLGIYLPVMNVEKTDLKTLFAENYEEYAKNVPLLFPRLTAWKKSDEKFDFQLYLNYREYRAAIGLIVALAILAAKALYFIYYDRGF